MSSIIPEAFIPLLDALTFTSPSPESRPFIKLWGEGTSVTTDGGKHLIKAVSLYLTEETKVSAASVRQKILYQLRENNHVATEQIADAFLGCVVAATSGGKNRADFWAECLQNFEKSNVSHFFILYNKAITASLYFDGYSVGPINIDVLKSRCLRATSDYAILHASQLEGRVALQSPELAHTVINFTKLSLDRGFYVHEIWKNALLNYFECISTQHFDFMWAHLDRTQVLSAPFDAEVLNVNSFRNEMGRFANSVTIYVDISSKRYGYVVPRFATATLNQPGPNSEIFNKFQKHRDEYRISEIGESELGRLLFECGKFCQQACAFMEAGRSNDAALYATICLEHVFSEKKSTSEAVCSRTAVLTHLRLKHSYESALIEMKKLYEARSGFVHAGRPVIPLNAERLIEYSREVLRSMLVLHLNSENRKSGFLNKWVKELDFTIASIESGKTLDNAFLAENGIFQ